MPEIKLKKRYKYAGDLYPQLLEIGFDNETAQNFLNDIKDADVVEVVRCKDCVWWEARVCGSTIGRCENPRNGLSNDYSDDGDFCSYGKRRE